MCIYIYSLPLILFLYSSGPWPFRHQRLVLWKTNFSTDGGLGDGFGINTLHLLCILFPLLLHQLNLRSSGIRSQMLGTPALESPNTESEARKEEKPIVTRAQSQVKNESYLLCFLVGQKYPRGYGHLHFLVLQVLVSAPHRYPGWEKPGAGSQHAWGALEASLSLLGVKSAWACTLQQELESVSGRQNANPQVRSRPNPQSLWMLPHSKREFADVIKNLNVERLPWII